MLNRCETKEEYQELEKTLSPLGFTQKTPGRFVHNLMPEQDFDFTACSTEGVIKIVFDMGFNVGVGSSRLQMRDALGLQT